MIELTFNGKEYNVKNDNDEINLETFQKITNILMDNENDYFFLKWCDVADILSNSTDLGDNICKESLVQLVKTLNIGNKVDEYTTTFEIDGFVYKVRLNEDGKPFYGGRDLGLIEKYIKDKPKTFLKYIMAILFRREDFKNHYDVNHINQKAKIFSENMTIDIAIPYVLDLDLTIMQDIQEIKKSFENDEK